MHRYNDTIEVTPRGNVLSAIVEHDASFRLHRSCTNQNLWRHIVHALVIQRLVFYLFFSHSLFVPCNSQTARQRPQKVADGVLCRQIVMRLSTVLGYSNMGSSRIYPSGLNIDKQIISVQCYLFGWKGRWFFQLAPHLNGKKWVCSVYPWVFYRATGIVNQIWYLRLGTDL